MTGAKRFFANQASVVGYCPSLGNLGKCVPIHWIHLRLISMTTFWQPVFLPISGFEINRNIHCLVDIDVNCSNLIFLSREILFSKSNCFLIGEQITIFSLTSLQIVSTSVNLSSIFWSLFSLNYGHIKHKTQLGS